MESWLSTPLLPRHCRLHIFCRHRQIHRSLHSRCKKTTLTKDQSSLDNTYIDKVLMKGLICVNFTLWGSITATKAQGLFPSKIEGEESRDSYQQLENHHFGKYNSRRYPHHLMQNSRFGSSMDKFDTIEAWNCAQEYIIVHCTNIYPVVYLCTKCIHLRQLHPCLHRASRPRRSCHGDE